MTLGEKLKKQLGRQLTVMLIPHSEFRPIRLNFSVSLLVTLGVAWTGLTIWSGFIASRHVDYWRAKADENVMKAKVWYLSQEMKRSREYLDRVRETEVALQGLLNMKTKKAILEADKDPGVGGPTNLDQRQLAGVLSGHRASLDIDAMNQQLQSVRQAGSDLVENYQEISKYIKDQRAVFRATPKDWPTVGRVTSNFGRRRDPFEQARGDHHHGLDIANALGTPIKATADGVVKIASWQGGYGRLVVIDHGHGYRTYYGHNSQLLVKAGEKVKRGQVISYMGTSGHSTGYHLHYEVWKDGKVVNPMKFVKANEE
jgi:murein DD-endopeptidase MepM/ murein hydrolase activator NlpD